MGTAEQERFSFESTIQRESNESISAESISALIADKGT